MGSLNGFFIADKIMFLVENSNVAAFEHIINPQQKGCFIFESTFISVDIVLFLLE